MTKSEYVTPREKKGGCEKGGRKGGRSVVVSSLFLTFFEAEVTVCYPDLLYERFYPSRIFLHSFLFCLWFPSILLSHRPLPGVLSFPPLLKIESWSFTPKSWLDLISMRRLDDRLSGRWILLSTELWNTSLLWHYLPVVGTKRTGQLLARNSWLHMSTLYSSLLI